MADVRALFGIGLAVGLAGAACSLLTDFGALEGSSGADATFVSSEAGASSSGFPSDGGGTSSGAASSSGVASSSGDSGHPADGGRHCRGTRGISQVEVNGYCIDSTEATADSYKQFLAAIASQLPDAGPGCEWKTEYKPGMPLGSGDAPVWAPDWCEAKAYCEWAGKRLCGAITGGPVRSDLITNAFADEWFAACSHDGARSYPYGSTYDPQACNGDNRDAGRFPIGVAELPGCVGGYPGIYDLSGNLWEWENSCEGSGKDAGCSIRGGSYASMGQDSCAENAFVPRDGTGPSDLTIRCCSDLEP